MQKSGVNYGTELKEDREVSSFIRMERYKITGHVITGSYGTIYRAIVNETQERVIMKSIHKTRYIAENEGNVLSVLNHPHIIRLLDRFEDGEHYILILEEAPRGD